MFAQMSRPEGQRGGLFGFWVESVGVGHRRGVCVAVVPVDKKNKGDDSGTHARKAGRSETEPSGHCHARRTEVRVQNTYLGHTHAKRGEVQRATANDKLLDAGVSTVTLGSGKMAHAINVFGIPKRKTPQSRDS